MRKLAAAVITTVGLLVTANDVACAEKLSPDAVRSFVEAQNRAWADRDFAHYYATFDPRAEIVTIKTTPDGKTVRTVNSPTEDRKGAEKFFATTRATISETDRIDKIAISPDGRHAHVRVFEETTMVENGKSKLLHAIAEEELEFRNGRIIAHRLTEKR